MKLYDNQIKRKYTEDYDGLAADYFNDSLADAVHICRLITNYADEMNANLRDDWNEELLTTISKHAGELTGHDKAELIAVLYDIADDIDRSNYPDALTLEFFDRDEAIERYIFNYEHNDEKREVFESLFYWMSEADRAIWLEHKLIREQDNLFSIGGASYFIGVISQ